MADCKLRDFAKENQKNIGEILKISRFAGRRGRGVAPKARKFLGVFFAIADQGGGVAFITYCWIRQGKLAENSDRHAMWRSIFLHLPILMKMKQRLRNTR